MKIDGVRRQRVVKTGKRRRSWSGERLRLPSKFLAFPLSLLGILVLSLGGMNAAAEEKPHWTSLSVRVPSILVTDPSESGLGSGVPFAAEDDERFVFVELGDLLMAMPPLPGEDSTSEPPEAFTNSWDDRIRFTHDEAASWDFVRRIALARGVVPMGPVDGGRSTSSGPAPSA
jgi:hypothetical protein